MKLYSPKCDPIAANALTILSSLMFLIILSFVFGEKQNIPVPPATWIAVAYSIIPGSLMEFYIFVWLLEGILVLAGVWIGALMKTQS